MISTHSTPVRLRGHDTVRRNSDGKYFIVQNIARDAFSTRFGVSEPSNPQFILNGVTLEAEDCTLMCRKPRRGDEVMVDDAGQTVYTVIQKVIAGGPSDSYLLEFDQGQQTYLPEDITFADPRWQDHPEYSSPT